MVRTSTVHVHVPTSGSLNERGGLVDEAPFDSFLAGGRGGGCRVKRRGKKMADRNNVGVTQVLWIVVHLEHAWKKQNSCVHKPQYIHTLICSGLYTTSSLVPTQTFPCFQCVQENQEGGRLHHKIDQTFLIFLVWVEKGLSTQGYSQVKVRFDFSFEIDYSKCGANHNVGHTKCTTMFILSARMIIFHDQCLSRERTLQLCCSMLHKN